MTRFIYSNGSVLMADHDESGEPENEPNFPFEVVMVPVDLPQWNERDMRFYDYIPRHIREGTHMFDVMVRRAPTDHHDDPDSWQKIGIIKTTSDFTKSLWGDERLFFRHTSM